jgi:putative restriction endonuclease
LLGTVAVTDTGWYEYLRARPDLTEVNFWRPSARRAFRAPEFSPFLFKLRAPHYAICGFAWFARYSPLPIWMAWETFDQANGCATRAEMEARLATIRKRIGFNGGDMREQIGCTLLVDPVFFPPEAWVRQPDDWRIRTQTDKKYDLSAGEGRRVWEECQHVALELGRAQHAGLAVADVGPRYGDPKLIKPRLGQRTFRIAVTDAYGRACAVTGEHSLPALDAGHIRPYSEGGQHLVSNGLLLRADLHRLFDKGYVAFDEQMRLVVSPRLKEEFSNGKTYYPLAGSRLRVPRNLRDSPDLEALKWHRNTLFAA